MRSYLIFKYGKYIILFLVVSCCFCSIPVATVYFFFLSPAAAQSEPEHIPDAMDQANNYFGGGIPLPDDVILTNEIMEFAEGKGYHDELKFYKPLQACIAAADLHDIPRPILCSSLDMVDSDWRGNLGPQSFVTAVGTARWLIKEGFDINDPSAKYEVRDEEDGRVVACKNKTCESLFTFFNNDTEQFLRNEDNIKEWEIVDTAELHKVSYSELYRYPEVFQAYWNLSILGYGDVLDGDVKYIPTDPDFPDDPSPIPNGEFVHPVPGGCISGYRFHSGHPGVDYSCSPDGWARAAHNGTVTVSGWSNVGYGWVTIVQGKFPDGRYVCTLYAHGQETVRNVGDKLKAGEAVFKIGSTGNSTGPHLHFEIRVGGSGSWCYPATFINPLEVLPPQ